MSEAPICFLESAGSIADITRAMLAWLRTYSDAACDPLVERYAQSVERAILLVNNRLMSAVINGAAACECKQAQTAPGGLASSSVPD